MLHKAQWYVNNTQDNPAFLVCIDGAALYHYTFATFWVPIKVFGSLETEGNHSVVKCVDLVIPEFGAHKRVLVHGHRNVVQLSWHGFDGFLTIFYVERNFLVQQVEDERVLLEKLYKGSLIAPYGRRDDDLGVVENWCVMVLLHPQVHRFGTQHLTIIIFF